MLVADQASNDVSIRWLLDGHRVGARARSASEISGGDCPICVTVRDMVGDKKFLTWWDHAAFGTVTLLPGLGQMLPSTIGGRMCSQPGGRRRSAPVLRGRFYSDPATVVPAGRGRWSGSIATTNGPAMSCFFRPRVQEGPSTRWPLVRVSGPLRGARPCLRPMAIVDVLGGLAKPRRCSRVVEHLADPQT